MQSMPSGSTAPTKFGLHVEIETLCSSSFEAAISTNYALGGTKLNSLGNS